MSVDHTPRMAYVFPSSKLPDVIRCAYRMSAQQGIGLFHTAGKDDEMPADELRHILARTPGCKIVGIGYSLGRAVQMDIHLHPDTTCSVRADKWYDHTLDQLQALATECGLGEPVERDDAWQEWAAWPARHSADARP